MRVVVLTGNQGNQRALCHRIASVCEIAAVVVSDNIPKKKPDLASQLTKFRQRITNRISGRPFVDAWFEMQAAYDSAYPNFPDAPLRRVNNVNDSATINVIAEHRPDLVVVSGTNLVGKSLIAACGETTRIVNLHTGISPYVKGGPNCTNWCLAKGWFHFIGNTVMWLDAGIDTGRIIATEQTPLAGTESLPELHRKVMDHGHDLYARVIGRLAGNQAVPSVAQSDICEGTLFYTADWNGREMRAAKANFESRYRQHFADVEGKRKLDTEVRLISL